LATPVSRIGASAIYVAIGITRPSQRPSRSCDDVSTDTALTI